jgi:hypothetical protein
MESKHLARDMKKAAQISVMHMLSDTGAEHRHIKDIIYCIQDHISAMEKRA